MFEARPYQDDIIQRAAQSLKAHQSSVIQLGTGGGKTGLASLLAGRCVAKGKRILFTVHRDFLLDQTMMAFENVNLDFGIVAAGFSANYRAPAQIASINSLARRLDKIRPVDLVIVDECHHILAPSWLAVVRHFMEQGAKVLGLTATPWRASGAALGSVFTDMVCGPSVRWLIDNGYLSKYRAFAPSIPDLKGVHTRAGDYAQDEIDRIMDKPTLVGDAIATMTKHCPNGQALAFCVSVMHSEHTAAAFSAAGITARHIDGETPRDERRAIIQAFRRKDIRVLTSVEIFGEGFDSPAVDCLLLLRPTQSLALHLQQLGRGLRTAPGKEYVTICDHAGNLLRPHLGLPDQDFQWSLEGGAERKKSDEQKSPGVKQCAECFRAYPATRPSCPECGAVPEGKPREIETREGDLQEINAIDLFRAKAQRQREQQHAKSLDDLIAIGRRRGYKNPGFWARQVWGARQQKRSVRSATR